ncbi:MAG: OmpA family protein [Hyphomicrobium sp.]
MLTALCLFAPGVAGTANAAQPVLTPEQKAKIEALKKKKLQQQPGAAVTRPPNPAVVVKPPARVVPKVVPKAVVRTAPPPVVKVAPKVVVKPAVVRPAQVKPAIVNKAPVSAGKTIVTSPNTGPNTRRPFVRKFARPPANVQPNVAAPAKAVSPAAIAKPTVSPFAKPNGSSFAQPTRTPVVTPAAVKPVMPANLKAIQDQRQRIVSKRTNAVVIKEPGNRTIVKRNNRSVIVHDETTRMKRVAPNAQVQKQKDGSNVTIIERPNNVTIYNVTSDDGQLIRRYRRDGDGHEHDIIDNRRQKSRWRRNLAIGLGVGVGVVAGAAILNAMVDVPPARVDLPPRKYVVDYEDASDDDVYEAFNAPPVEHIERRYTLDEVRATPRLRERMRRVDLNDITFETGSFEVDEGQFSKLERAARALMRVIEANPNEVFLVEGYTDAVGPAEDNLTLSDRRAESVAVILTEQFQVPPENLTTQGYGEEYLKIDTDGPERANRRVAVRRITPLISQEGAPPPPPQ